MTRPHVIPLLAILMATSLSAPIVAAGNEFETSVRCDGWSVNLTQTNTPAEANPRHGATELSVTAVKGEVTRLDSVDMIETDFRIEIKRPPQATTIRFALSGSGTPACNFPLFLNESFDRQLRARPFTNDHGARRAKPG